MPSGGATAVVEQRGVGGARLPAEPTWAFPEPRPATAPPEARGLARDEVALLVSDGAGHHAAAFLDLAAFLEPGDLVVVNDSATLPARVPLRWPGGDGVLHLATRYAPGLWLAEPRWSTEGVERGASRLLQARILREAQVIVRAGDHHLAAVHRDRTAMLAGDGTDVGVEAQRGGVLGPRERVGLGEDVLVRRVALPRDDRAAARHHRDGAGVNGVGQKTLRACRRHVVSVDATGAGVRHSGSSRPGHASAE